MTSQHKRFQEIFEQHWAMLYEVAYRKTESEADAKDIIQELFIHIWNLGVWEEGAVDIKFYLLRALRNRLFNYFRDKGVQDKHVESFLRMNSAVSVDAINDLTVVELQHLIEAEIDKLPIRMREIFMLSREDGLSTEEIAIKLDIAPQTVKNQITETLKRVRHGLRHYPIALFLLTLSYFYFRSL